MRDADHDDRRLAGLLVGLSLVVATLLHEAYAAQAIKTEPDRAQVESPR